MINDRVCVVVVVAPPVSASAPHAELLIGNMEMMGTHNTKLQILQWQLAMMSADSLHSVAAMMRDHLCWLHLYVVLPL